MVFSKEEKMAIATVIASIAQFQAGLAPLSNACDAIVDAMIELQGGNISDDAFERGAKAMTAMSKFDIGTFQSGDGKCN